MPRARARCRASCSCSRTRTRRRCRRKAAPRSAPRRAARCLCCRTPMEHHNPMEPHATVAHWEGDRLTLWDATQFVDGVRNTVAKTLGLAPEKLRVIDPYVGGGFGCKGSTWSHVVLAAMAAREAKRPVKL